MKPSERFDWHGVMRRVSTWLSAVATGCTLAGVQFSQGPAEWREGFPPNMGMYLLIAGTIAASLVPLATSFRQKSLNVDESDQAGA